MTVPETAKKYPQGLVGRAYRFSENAHKGQKRKTEEPYFNHALAAAETLLEWKLDEATVAAGLLHDTVEDTGVSLEAIRKEFGDEVAFLVDGVTKLGKIKYRGQEARAENLRKMVLAISQDLRVIFVKLADRLHNMKTLSALPREKQKRVAMETSEIYAPLAYRLGMQTLSGDLEDLAFPFIHPDEYKWLKVQVKEEYEKRNEYLERIKPEVEKILSKEGIKALVIDFRAKHYSSLYKKLLRYNMDFEKIYDLVAFRIILKTVDDCYAALGLIHKLWPPLPGRIKDYIASPKPNRYQSLHTTVIGPEEKIVEFQIRTKEMHQEAELGIAAHWVYQQQKGFRSYFQRMPARVKIEDIEWVRQLRNWLSTRSSLETKPEEFVESMKIDFFKDRIFVITPRGDVLDLPAGSTPVDFAYHIHSEIGDTCVGAKINGTFTPLDEELRSGDVVQIITQKNKKPSKDWLNFAKTAVAKNHIRNALKEKEQILRKRVPTRTEIRLVVKDRIGLLKDVTAAIASSHVSILNLHTSAPSGSEFPTDKIEIATTDKKKIEKLILKLKKIKEIKEISYKII